MPPVSLIPVAFATGGVENGGKFSAGIVDTGGQFATGVNNTGRTGGKFATGVVDKNFEMTLMLFSEASGRVIHEKNVKQKFS